MRRSILLTAIVIWSTTVPTSSAQVLRSLSYPVTDSTVAHDDAPVGVNGLEKGYKSSGTGWLLALGSTFVPIVVATKPDIVSNGNSFSQATIILAVASTYVGPSIGNLYAGDHKRAWAGVGARLLGTLVIAAGAGGDILDESSNSPELLLTGLGIFVGSAVWNLFTINRSVESHNNALREQRVAMGLRIDPSTRAAALQLAVKF